MKILVVVLIAGLVCQAYSQKSGHSHKQKHGKHDTARKEPIDHASHPTDSQSESSNSNQQQNLASGQAHAGIPQMRHCTCDELEKCYQEQTSQFDDLSNQCRQQCGLAFLTNDTAEHVANCYDAFEKSKRNQKTNKHRCVENLTSKPCIDGHQQQQPPPSQATLTVDPTKMVHHRPKRSFKHLLPPNSNMYASCVKICRKNGGSVQFNPDGTMAKAGASKSSAAGNQAAQQEQQIPAANVKPGKGYAACAQKLNCQLVPIDKKLEKQAKQICKYETAQTEDHAHTLCTCLGGVFKQNFQCDPAVQPQDARTCSSESAETTGCTQNQGHQQV